MTALRLRVVCAWCGHIKHKGDDGAETSHTICEPCSKRWVADAGVIADQSERSTRVGFSLALFLIVALTAWTWCGWLIWKSWENASGPILPAVSAAVVARSVHLDYIAALRAPLGESDPFHVLLTKHLHRGKAS